MSPAQPSVEADGISPPGVLPVNNGVVDAFYLLQNAEALYQSRLRDRLQLGANELGAMLVISRLATLGLDARALDISRSLGVTSGATSVILGHLIARGYLTRTANPRDGRGKLLHLTEEATTTVRHSLDDSQSDLSLLVSGLSTRESKRVVVLLTAVTSSLDRSGHPEV
ncbi:MarR family transcriptional regulator [Cryobacterium lactosi]|uniref:MarR family transcriptional regulator n=1 Tax=Cryobacterium lactosi TaxID=1259202 RepID=A0A4R9BTC9_9MICO|nr:MarR family transcriptional regulator [Cryobacterium lactosi]TFD90634.1 MarR family transcriptional regulator [Cryobacterium lactosi]